MLKRVIDNALEQRPRLVCVVTWIIRLTVGCVFIISGFTKAVDPWGTLYKVDAYLASMSLSVWPNLVVVGVFGLCAVEFFIGICLAAGCLRRTSPILVLIIMAFMLPLTLWIAIKNPVSDCGCFGDAIILSNWATFWKNIVLTVLTLWLLAFNKSVHWLITPALQWIAILGTGLFIMAVEMFGYVAQPLLDFRAYKVGQQLVDRNDRVQDEPEYVFIYEKDGERREFNISDELPDEQDGWIFIDRREVESTSDTESGNDTEPTKNLRIWTPDGRKDVTEDEILAEGKELLVMIPSLPAVSPATTWKLNSLYEWAVKNDVKMIGVVAGSIDEINDWEDLSMASYPIFSADDTQIKEVVRGNPGMVYLENGEIIWKSTLTAINIDDFLSPDTSDDARKFGMDNLRILRNCVYLYAMIISVLVFLSFIPSLKNVYLSAWRKGKNHS